MKYKNLYVYIMQYEIKNTVTTFLQTSKGHLLMFQLEQDIENGKGCCLYKYKQRSTHQGESKDSVAAIRLSLAFDIACDSEISW